MYFKDISDSKRVLDKLKWPELRWVWILLGMIFGAMALGAYFMPPAAAFADFGVLAIAGGLTFAAVYRSAKTERENKLESGELKNILFGLYVALIVYDRDFNAVFFNPAAEKLFKLSAGEVIGHHFEPQDIERPSWKLLSQVIFPSLAPTVVSRSKVGEYPQVVDLSFADPQLELRVSTLPVSGEKKELLGFMKVVRDRTREISLIKSKSEFLTVASHQLRTPVTDINWALQSLEKDESLSSESRSIVETAIGAGKGLLETVEDLLDVAKIEEGHFGYKFEATDIVQFLEKLLAGILPMAQRAGVKIYFDKPKGRLPEATVDPQKLPRALNNILENAVRYNVENGKVTVKVEKIADQPFLDISVKDTGIGIEAEDMPRLFTKFFRSDRAVKTRTDGSGLGLYIAKNIAQAHGGRIWVESEPDRGSIFHLAVPTDPNLIPQHEVALEE